MPESPGGAEPPADPVETALAKALGLAAQAQEWAVVSELGRQLEARRRERVVAPGVVDLDAARDRKDRGK